MCTLHLNSGYSLSHKGPGKRGHIVEDKLLPTQMFPRLSARATFVADTNFAQPKKHHEQQCVRKNVSSFARAIKWPVKMHPIIVVL